MNTLRYAVLSGLFLCQWSYAQIQIEDLIEDPEPAVSNRSPEAIVDAPESQDHSTGPVASADRLNFVSEDTLQGELKRIESNGMLTWIHPSAESPIEFKVSALLDAELKGPFPVKALENTASVRLTNGDTYRGKVLSMDSESLVLKTPFAGELKLATPMIQSILPHAGSSSSLYQGPNSISEWEQSRNHGGNKGWYYEKNALYNDGGSSHTIAKSFPDMPEMASIEFDMAWKGNLQFYMMLWADKTKNSRNYYNIMLQHGYIRCHRNSSKGSQDLGNAQLNSLRSLSEAKVKILLNQKEKEIYLFINEELVKKWSDSGRQDEIKGDVMLLRASGSSPMKIENIHIRAWDGKINSGEIDEKAERDMLVLKNGDSFSGDLQKIKSGVITFKTDFAELPVPVKRVSEIIRGTTEQALPRKQAGDVLMYFPTDERITLKLDQWAAGKASGSSETTGGITLDTSFITKIEFNPYDETVQEKSSAW